MQGVRAGELRLWPGRGEARGTVLLRSDLRVRPHVRVPRRVRVPGRGDLRGEGRPMSALGSVRYAERVMSTTHAPSPTRGGMTDGAPAVMAALMAAREELLAFARRRVRSGADAEDLLQQALMKATEHAAELREPEHVRAWFYRILRRTIADHHAKWALREAKLEMLAGDMEEATAEEVAVCGCSLGRLEALRPDYASIVRRVDLDEEPLAEVAEALGITVNAATVRLHRARKALRADLLDFCGTCSASQCASCSCD